MSCTELAYLLGVISLYHSWGWYKMRMIQEEEIDAVVCSHQHGREDTDLFVVPRSVTSSSINDHWCLPACPSVFVVNDASASSLIHPRSKPSPSSRNSHLSIKEGEILNINLVVLITIREIPWPSTKFTVFMSTFRHDKRRGRNGSCGPCMLSALVAKRERGELCLRSQQTA